MCTDLALSEMVRAARRSAADCELLLKTMVEKIIPKLIDEACEITGADPARVANRVDGAFVKGNRRAKATILRVFRNNGAVKKPMNMLAYAGKKNPGRVLRTYAWVYVFQAARELRPNLNGPIDEFDTQSKEPSFTIEDKEELELCMSLLSSDEVLAYSLYHVDDWSHAEIAREMRTSVSTVRRRLKAVQQRLDRFVQSRSV